MRGVSPKTKGRTGLVRNEPDGMAAPIPRQELRICDGLRDTRRLARLEHLHRLLECQPTFGVQLNEGFDLIDHRMRIIALPRVQTDGDEIQRLGVMQGNAGEFRRTDVPPSQERFGIR